MHVKTQAIQMTFSLQPLSLTTSNKFTHLRDNLLEKLCSEMKFTKVPLNHLRTESNSPLQRIHLQKEPMLIMNTLAQVSLFKISIDAMKATN